MIKLPETIPQTDFLAGDFGQAALEEYQGRAKADYQNAPVLNVLAYDQEKGLVTGSNPFAAVLMNDVLSQASIHIATPAELEQILQAEALPLAGTYEDPALALRSESDPNSYLAKNLLQQLKHRGKARLPAMILLKDLILKYDSSSPHLLAFTLREGAQPIYTPILNERSGNFGSECMDKEIGLPKKLSEQGNRMLWTSGSGLSRLFLDRGLLLNSYIGDLAGSDASGRVVAVSAGGAQKILETQLAELKKKNQKIIAAQNERFERAKSALYGK